MVCFLLSVCETYCRNMLPAEFNVSLCDFGRCCTSTEMMGIVFQLNMKPLFSFVYSCICIVLMKLSFLYKLSVFPIKYETVYSCEKTDIAR